MEDLVLDILDELRRSSELDAKALAALVRKHNDARSDVSMHLAKKHIHPFYLRVKSKDPARWARWAVDDELERRFLQTVQMKPRRTASGVATVTVITKPWPCASACLYCPNDVRMPKSYLADEPACQRAERNFFDPYLQVASRLRALSAMGHATDKVELIVLGGTWSDYPRAYQIWFARELFAALNEADDPDLGARLARRRAFYEQAGLSSDPDELVRRTRAVQELVNDGALSYNGAFDELYRENPAWQAMSARQTSDFAELEEQQAANEKAAHRAVGLVLETRPEAATPENLKLMRRLGCTKVQMGLQSLDASILAANDRAADLDTARGAFDLVRAFGFKIHAHLMVNLLGSTPETDKRAFERFVRDRSFTPDEVKLYPCALVAGTGLVERYRMGDWRPYTEDELVDVLAHDLIATPPYLRISRMVRDISARDIMVGNKKTNLRQTVEAAVARSGRPVAEIRYREIATEGTDIGSLTLETVPYDTASTREFFLQWTAPDNRIAGLLRLSLPRDEYVRDHADDLPVRSGEAMIREVHVYGRVAHLHTTGAGAQHLGLGKRLIEEACRIAREQGYERVNVISAVGTRAYYRGLGFSDCGLYLQKAL